MEQPWKRALLDRMEIIRGKSQIQQVTGLKPVKTKAERKTNPTYQPALMDFALQFQNCVR